MRRRALVVMGAALAARAGGALTLALLPRSGDERRIVHDGVARFPDETPGARIDVPVLLRKRACTPPMGNLLEAPARPHVRAELGGFPFPRLDPRVAACDDAPVDVPTLDAPSRRPGPARQLLRRAARSDPQARLARASAKVSTNRLSAFSGNRLTRADADLPRGSGGLARSCDRDAPVALDRPEQARRTMRKTA